MILYNKLWKLLEERELNKTYLRNHGIHPVVIARMGKNEITDGETINKICEILKCQPGEIIEWIPDDPDEYERLKLEGKL